VLEKDRGALSDSHKPEFPACDRVPRDADPPSQLMLSQVEPLPDRTDLYAVHAT